MKYIKYLTLALVAFVFVGCTPYSVPVTYDGSYIESEIKDFHKINGNVVVNDSKKIGFSVVQTFRPFVDIPISADASFSKEISRNFLSQYFTKVEISNNIGLFNFDMDLQNIKAITLNNQPSYEIKFKITVVKDGRIILEKDYTGINKAPIFIESKYFYSLSESSSIYSRHTIQLGFHKMLEEQVKPDLLKALKENK